VSGSQPAMLSLSADCASLGSASGSERAALLLCRLASVSASIDADARVRPVWQVRQRVVRCCAGVDWPLDTQSFTVRSSRDTRQTKDDEMKVAAMHGPRLDVCVVREAR
jgi:hypothetical protein